MVDGETFRAVLGHYPTGVCVVTSTDREGRPLGMSVGTFTSVSLDPPLVAFLPHRDSATWRALRATGRFCVNVLTDVQAPVSRRFATRSEDRFAGVCHRPSPLGSPVFDGVAAWVDCRLHAVHEAGDHHIAVGEVVSLELGAPARPLLFYRGTYGRLAPARERDPAARP